MLTSRFSRLAAAALMLAGAAGAQTAADTPAPATAPASSPFTHFGTDFSFLFDGYVNANFNSPDSGYNGLRNFDMRANSMKLNMAKITIDHAPGPVGFHLDIGLGETFKIVGAVEPGSKTFKYFEQAYVTLKPKSWKGLQIDFGKFNTSAGAEVIESNANWNYSRSLLFAWAIPYYHMGVRTSFPITSKYTAGVQVVQGWNNVKDNNSGKTIGLTGVYTFKKGTWSQNYYVGPEKTDTNKGWRQVFDTTVLVNPTDNDSLYVNVDYGHEKALFGGSNNWSGIAGAYRHQLKKGFAVAARTEYFADSDGFSTGTVQHVKEVTLTVEHKLASYLLTRAEFRNDWSDVAFFQKNSGEAVKTQPTFLVGLVATFGPKK
jgi:hypothetical protein